MQSKIEWCDYTWNPVTGCEHGCHYCYAAKMAVRFTGDIRWNLRQEGCYKKDGQMFVLEQPMKNESGKVITYPFGFMPTYHRYKYGLITGDRLVGGKNIFVGSMADVFGNWVPDWVLNEIFHTCLNEEKHNYMFLTKNPIRYEKYGVPDYKKNFWYGTTITGNKDVYNLLYLPKFAKKFVSIEPLLSPIKIAGWSPDDVDWIIVGAETGNRKNKIIPKKEWIEEITDWAVKNNIPIFYKDSLIPIMGKENMKREFPEELQHRKLGTKLQKKMEEACMKCKQVDKKANMVNLQARTKRGTSAVSFAYMCKTCFKNFCTKNNTKIPELPGLEGEESE